MSDYIHFIFLLIKHYCEPYSKINSYINILPLAILMNPATIPEMWEVLQVLRC
jgi:hypothetical protein